MENVTYITTDGNGNKWFNIDGNTYGITEDGRVMDDQGIPYQPGSQEAADVKEAIGKKN